MRKSLCEELIFHVLLGISLVACAPVATPMVEKPAAAKPAQTDACLPPIYGDGFSYPIRDDLEGLSYPGLDMNVPPPEPWQVETPLPQFEGIANWERRDLGVVQVRHFKNYSEVWVHVTSGLEQQAYLAVYRTDTKKWKVIPEQIDTLFVDKNGALWGSHSGYYGYASEPFGARPLSKYDEVTGNFVEVEAIHQLPAVVKVKNYDYYSRVLFDNDGIFWILVPADGIYKFDPGSGSLEKIFKLYEGGFRDAQIASDGVIYILYNNVYYVDEETRFDYILKFYDTTTVKESEYALIYYLEPYPKPITLMIDRQERIWLDNIAYIDKGVVYQILRSPLFVSPIRQEYSDYRYKSADVLLQSSDGRVWFRHNNGMISLDPQKGEWCWFTTYQSNIVEDSERNLWMIADGKLYKNALGK